MMNENKFDRAALERIQQLGGDDLLAQMIDLFLEHAPQKLETARCGRGSGDMKAVAFGLHSIKSSADNLGAQRLRELAEEMESLAMTGDESRIPSMWPDLEDCFSEVVTDLERLRQGLLR
jgi:HPt (histidine-containing phosphotransfer) domain-containing protein